MFRWHIERPLHDAITFQLSVHLKGNKRKNPVDQDASAKRKKPDQPPSTGAPAPKGKGDWAQGRDCPCSYSPLPFSGKTLMELLELEMRARAIKALLNKKEENPTEPAETESREVEEDPKEDESKEASTAAAGEDKQKAQQLLKAREALLQSEVKQKEEQKEIERKQEELVKRAEEARKKQEAKEAAEKKKQEEAVEKERKKKKKEEEYQNFLKWKEEKRKQEDFKRRLEEEVEQELQEEKARESLKAKEREMKFREEEEKRAMEQQAEPIKKPTMDRVDVEVEDDLDRDFDISLDYGSPIDAEEEEAAERQVEEEAAAKTRRYRRKAKPEEGEALSDSPDRRSSRSPSFLSSLTSESENEQEKVERLRKVREERVAEIRRRRRKKKPAEDIEEGEVDSEGEHFEPIEKQAGEESKGDRVIDKENTDGSDGRENDNDTDADEETLAKYDVSKVEQDEVKLSGKKDSEPIKPESVEATAVKEKTNENVSVQSTADPGKAEPRVQRKLLKETKRSKRKSTEPVLIKDDSDNENLFSTSEDEEVVVKEGREDSRGRGLQHRRGRHTESPQGQRMDQESHEEEVEETEEERELRLKREDEERQRQEKMERLRQERIKRMEAFQKRTEIQEEVIEHEEEEPEEEKQLENRQEPSTVEGEEDGKVSHVQGGGDECTDGVDNSRDEPTRDPGTDDPNDVDSKLTEVGKSVTAGGDSDFYKSFYEQEKMQKEEGHSKEKAAAASGDAEEAKDPDAVVDVDVSSASKKVRKPKDKEKSKEELMLEGVGFWSKLCKSQGDFDAPTDVEKASSEAKAAKDRGKMFSSEAPQASTSKELPRNRDCPTKEEVDRQQEELENMTWADRWFQNKKVQKVVKDSKMMSKVRTKIKLKEFKLGGESSSNSPKQQQQDPAAKELPKIIGTYEEYSQILGKKGAGGDDDEKDPQDRDRDSVDESEEEEDDLWGAIMGSKS